MDARSTSCGTCMFFDDHHLNGGQTSAADGLCRFNPPISQPEPDKHGLWPVVTERDWCGHFSAGAIVGRQAAE